MYYFVYETTNLINGKKYRGAHSTENICDGYLGSGIALHRAIKKYGKDNFSRSILEFYDSLDDLYAGERAYVDNIWVLNEFSYNLCIGGGKSGAGVESKLYGNKLSKETRNKIGIANKRALLGKKIPIDVKVKISCGVSNHWRNNEHPFLTRHGKSTNRYVTISDEVLQTIFKLYLEYYSINEISKFVSISPKIIRSRLVSAGIYDVNNKWKHNKKICVGKE